MTANGSVYEGCKMEVNGFQFVGWGTSLNYEGDIPRGAEHFEKCIREMGEAGLNYLSILMYSDQYHGEAAGYAWPVQDPELSEVVDKDCPNANPETEFLPELVAEAHRKGIRVDLAMGTPQGRLLLPKHPEWTMMDFWGNEYPLPTPASAAFQDANCRLIRDLLGRYGRAELGEKAVDGFYNEGPTYGPMSHYSASDRQQFERMFGKPLAEATIAEMRAFKLKVVSEFLQALFATVKEVNPNLARGQHCWETSFTTDRGHDVREYVKAGVQYAVPGHHSFREEELCASLDYYCPYLPSIIHFNARRRPPKNYPVPPVHPEDVFTMAEWAKRYKAEGKYGHNLVGVLFFNEAHCPPDNRKAVFEALAQLREGKS